MIVLDDSWFMGVMKGVILPLETWHDWTFQPYVSIVSASIQQHHMQSAVPLAKEAWSH